MPQGDVASKLAAAKATLSHADNAFPSSMAPKAPAPAQAPMPRQKPAASTTAKELNVKQANVDEYLMGVPKMHKGGVVPKSGVYRMQQGEGVISSRKMNSMKKGMAVLGAIKGTKK